MRRRLLALAPLAMAASGCLTLRSGGAEVPVARSVVCTPPATPMIRSTLYFGLVRAHGGVVTMEQWEEFLAREITPRFDGLTVLEARGQWIGPNGTTVREPSRVVVLVHADSSRPRDAIAAVIHLYRTELDQESVLWEMTAACATF